MMHRHVIHSTTSRSVPTLVMLTIISLLPSSLVLKPTILVLVLMLVSTSLVLVPPISTSTQTTPLAPQGKAIRQLDDAQILKTFKIGIYSYPILLIIIE